MAIIISLMKRYRGTKLVLTLTLTKSIIKIILCVSYSLTLGRKNIYPFINDLESFFQEKKVAKAYSDK